MQSEDVSLTVLRIFFVYFDFYFYSRTWRHKCLCSWIWFPRHHELKFLPIVSKGFSPLRVQSIAILRAF